MFLPTQSSPENNGETDEPLLELSDLDFLQADTEELLVMTGINVCQTSDKSEIAGIQVSYGVRDPLTGEPSSIRPLSEIGDVTSDDLVCELFILSPVEQPSSVEIYKDFDYRQFNND